MGNLVEYEEYTEEDAETELRDMTSTQMFKFEPGRSIVRFVPARKGESLFEKTFSHFLGDQDDGIGVNCPRLMTKGRKRCPICEFARKLDASGDPIDQERAQNLFARRRVYASIIDRKNPEAGVQVVAFGKMIHEELAKLRRDNLGGGDFVHPETGFDIIVERSGTTKKGTKYGVRRHPERTALGESVEQMNEWISGQPDKKRYAQLMEAEEIAEASAKYLGPAFRGPAIEAASKPAGAIGPTVNSDLSDEPDDDIPY